MRMISKILLGTAAAASIATAGIAYAAPGMDGPGKDRPDVTRVQAEERANAMFDRMDANKDGKPDKADHEARQKARFDRMDANKDGSLSREEFAARPDRRGPEGTGPQGQKAEGKRGDGQHFGGRHHGGRGGKHHGMGGMRGSGGMMKQADTNGDGAISKAEFVAAHLAKFDASDTDRNGTVTAAERKTQHDKMRTEWQAKRSMQQQQKAQ